MPQARTMSEPKYMPLVATLSNRDYNLNTDARLVNAYAEKDPLTGMYNVIKRYGTAVQYSYAAMSAEYPSISKSTLGMYGWNYTPTNGTYGKGNSELLYIMGGYLFVNFIPIFPITGNGPATFTPILNQANPQIFIKTVSSGYYLNAQNVTTKIVDSNYPVNTVPGSVYLDGTTYVMDTLGNIWGSANLNDVSTWDPLNVIVAGNQPDIPVYLALQVTYIVAIKSNSIQFFYDAGNTTGSPLAEVPGTIINFGCADPASVQQFEDVIVFVTNNIEGISRVAIMKNLQPQIVSTPFVERVLRLNGLGYGEITSLLINLDGHIIYVITNQSLNVSMAYDIEQKLWYQWTDASGNMYPVAAVTNGYPTLNSLICIDYSGNVNYLSPHYATPNDNGVVPPVDIYTPNFDGGIDRQKFLHMMRFNGDQQAGSKLKVRSSDDDYKKYTNFRTVDLSIRRPVLDNCGAFYRRSWHLRHQSNTPFRLNAVALEMDVGIL
jgi:hypothetical protein